MYTSRGPEKLHKTGRTTRQIKNAPLGALFLVYPATNVQKVKELRASLGRLDIEVEDATWIMKGFGTKKWSAIILDHQIQFDVDAEWDAYERAQVYNAYQQERVL